MKFMILKNFDFCNTVRTYIGNNLNFLSLRKERIIQFYTKYALGCPPVSTSIVPIVVS